MAPLTAQIKRSASRSNTTNPMTVAATQWCYGGYRGGTNRIHQPSRDHTCITPTGWGRHHDFQDAQLNRAFKLPSIHPGHMGSGLPDRCNLDNENVKINRDAVFPYLDTELYRYHANLEFRVHLKRIRLLEYLNRGSMNTAVCFKAVPHGFIRCPTSLTSMTNENADKRINVLYLEHATALKWELSWQHTTSAEYPTLWDSLGCDIVRVEPIQASPCVALKPCGSQVGAPGDDFVGQPELQWAHPEARKPNRYSSYPL